MALEEHYFKKICERCENHAVNMSCEDKMMCPAYGLYCLATSDKKRKVNIKYEDWKEPPQPPTGII